MRSAVHTVTLRIIGDVATMIAEGDPDMKVILTAIGAAIATAQGVTPHVPPAQPKPKKGAPTNYDPERGY